MSMTYTAYVMHHIPGRIRIKLPQARGNLALLEQIKESISPQSGVGRVDVNPTTGSVLIHYDPDRLDDIKRHLAEHAEHENLFRFEVNSQKEASVTARSLDDLLVQLDEVTQRATAGTIGLRELFPFAIAAYALFWVDRAQGAPMWLSMLFFSFNSYMDLHQEEPQSQKITEAIEALRAEIAALRAELRSRA